MIALITATRKYTHHCMDSSHEVKAEEELEDSNGGTLRESNAVHVWNTSEICVCLKVKLSSWAWWHRPTTPALGGRGRRTEEFKKTLRYTANSRPT